MICTENLPGPFEVEHPEVYQLEISSACNLNCIMCPRKYFPRKDTKDYISLELIDKLIEEDSFKGTYFLELQMSGEPLLHPSFYFVVQRLRDALPNIKLGLSTNGTKIIEHIQSLKKLDYITVSVDSITAYSDIRKGGNLKLLMAGIKCLQDNIDFNKTSVDLQLVELEGWEDQLKHVQNEFGDSPFNIRTVPDRSLTLHNEVDKLPVRNTPCVNPWWSVSIQSNGNVVPCCFCFGDDIILGNVHKASLSHIWKHSGTLKALKAAHTPDSGALMPMICQKCYMRSPAFLHWNIYCNSLKRKI